MRLERDCDVRRVGVEGFAESSGGDHAMRAFLQSKSAGSTALRTISVVARHWTCRRAPARQAMCAAVGDGTEMEDAKQVSLCWTGSANVYVLLNCGDTSALSIVSVCSCWVDQSVVDCKQTQVNRPIGRRGCPQ